MNLLWENIFKPNAKSRTIQKALTENILFKNLSSAELRFIESIIHVRNYRAGEAVFSQGDPGEGMYIILKGAVDIFVMDSEKPNTEGPQEIFVTRLEKDDFFGELSLVEETGARSATARTAEESVLLGFFKPDLLETIERNPSTGVKIVFRLAEVLGHRLKETTDKITRLKTELKAINTLDRGV